MSRRNNFVTNAVVNPTLRFAREVLGEYKFSGVLEASGLGHFVRLDLPENDDLETMTSEYSDLMAALRGLPDGDSVLREVGRRTFLHSLSAQGHYYRILSQAVLQAMPYNQAASAVLSAFTRAIMRSNPHVSAYFDTIKHGHFSPHTFQYHETTCAMCFGQTADAPICSMYTGSLSAAMYWATNRHHSVVEVDCMAMGGKSCAFLIEVTK